MLISVKTTKETSKGKVLKTFTDEIFTEYHLNYDNFWLLVTDGAAYMPYFFSMFKEKYVNLKPVLCVSHILNRCSVKIFEYFDLTSNF